MKPVPGSQLNPGHSLSSGMVGCFVLNEGSGQIIDLLAQHTPATLSGTTLPVWQAEPLGSCVQFNKGNANPQGATISYADCGTPALSSNLAAGPASWFVRFMLPAATRGAIVSRDDNISAGWHVGPNAVADTGNFALRIVNTATTMGAVITMPPFGAWHNILVVYDGNHLTAAGQKFYVDGAGPATHVSDNNGSGTIGSDAAVPMYLSRTTEPFSSSLVGYISTVVMWKNRMLTQEDARLLQADPWIYLRRPLKTVISLPLVPPAPSSDYVFYDSYPYERKNRIRQQQFQRDYIADASWAFQIPPPAAPNFGYHFYDSFPYARKAQIAQQGFPRSDTFSAFEQTVTPTGPAPSSDYIFYDYADYIRAKRQLAAWNRNYIADASWFAAIPAVPVPSFDYHFYDSTNYTGRANQMRQAAFDRNQSRVSLAANFPPAVDYFFYDHADYAALTRRLQNFPRNYVADASYLFAAAGVPNYGYAFYDSTDYNRKIRLYKNFPRDFIGDASSLPSLTFPVPNFGYHFYDQTNYTGRAQQIRQAAFERSRVVDAPPGVFITAVFVPPDGWYPIANPISIPVRPRVSDFFIGLPNDLRDKTLLPNWDFLQIGEDTRTLLMRYPQLRSKEWLKQEPPQKNTRTFLAVFFNATMAPFSASLQKTATRHFNATMNPFQAVLAVLTPRPAAIVGYALAVCQEIRTFIGHKFNLATICEDPRTLKVPVNTQSICQTFIKDPQATTDYSIDWTDPLVTAGDTIATSAWAADAGITVAKSTFTGYVTTAFLSGGIEGTAYSVTNTITTAGGRTLAQNFIIAAKLR